MTIPKHLISRLLLTFLLLFCSLANGRPLQGRVDDCDQFKVNVSVSDNNKVLVEVSGLKGKQVLHVIGGKGFSKMNISEEELQTLKKGSYVLIVIDQKDTDNYCQKHFDFIIK